MTHPTCIMEWSFSVIIQPILIKFGGHIHREMIDDEYFWLGFTISFSAAVPLSCDYLKMTYPTLFAPKFTRDCSDDTHQIWGEYNQTVIDKPFYSISRILPSCGIVTSVATRGGSDRGGAFIGTRRLFEHLTNTPGV